MRAEALRRALLTLAAYRTLFAWEPAFCEVRVHPQERGLSCGPGSSGCALPGGPIEVGSDLHALLHELRHLHLHALGDPLWATHAGPGWEKIYVAPAPGEVP